MKNKQREENEKLLKLQEEAEDDTKIIREQNQLDEKLYREDNARIAFRKRNELHGNDLDSNKFTMNHSKDLEDNMLENITIKAPHVKGKV